MNVTKGYTYIKLRFFVWQVEGMIFLAIGLALLSGL